MSPEGGEGTPSQSCSSPWGSLRRLPFSPAHPHSLDWGPKETVGGPGTQTQHVLPWFHSLEAVFIMSREITLDWLCMWVGDGGEEESWKFSRVGDEGHWRWLCMMVTIMVMTTMVAVVAASTANMCWLCTWGTPLSILYELPLLFLPTNLGGYSYNLHLMGDKTKAHKSLWIIGQDSMAEGKVSIWFYALCLWTS